MSQLPHKKIVRLFITVTTVLLFTLAAGTFDASHAQETKDVTKSVLDEGTSELPVVKGRIRAGYQYNRPWREKSNTSRDGDAFMIDELRLGVEGKIGKDIEYEAEIEVEFNKDKSDLVDDGGDPVFTDDQTMISAKDIFIRYRPADFLNFQVGQFKVPYSRNRLISTGKQLQNSRFDQIKEYVPGREKGLMGNFKLGMVELWAGMFNGNGDNMENGDDSGIVMYAARFELSPFGKMAKQEGGLTVNSFQLMLGGAVLRADEAGYDTGEKFAKYKKDAEKTGFCGDLTARFLGAFLNFEGHYTMWRPADSTGDDDWESYTLFAQLGYYIPLFGKGIEPTIRWGVTDPDDGKYSKGDTKKTIGFGLNYYHMGNKVKLQLDYRHNYKERDSDEDAWDENRFMAIIQVAI